MAFVEKALIVRLQINLKLKNFVTFFPLYGICSYELNFMIAVGNVDAIIKVANKTSYLNMSFAFPIPDDFYNTQDIQKNCKRKMFNS